MHAIEKALSVDGLKTILNTVEKREIISDFRVWRDNEHLFAPLCLLDCDAHVTE
jgi:hypothetical protein